ncbi:hypothetical protein M758_9G122500 [Ceratodon purpureus]|nr:hypothetical protein M758_9G122500 [Ceratodon purpureus]
MGAFTGVYDEPMVRIPPMSPSRRDYQLRSASPTPSRPQSPWRPREQVSPRGSQEIDTFRMYESYPSAARSNYYSGPLPSAPQGSSFYSGPLPSAPQGVDRSYYSGPLPTITPPSQPYFSGPLSGFSTTTTESFDFEFSTWAKIYHGQHDSNSVSESPEVGSRTGSRTGSRAGSSQEGKSVRGHYDHDADWADDEPSTFYLSNPAESRARANAEFAERAGKYGPARNCVSGELGISEAIAKQKSQVARGYKSGEILGLNICADGIYNSSPPAAIVVETPGPRHSGPTAAWDALMKDAKKDMKNDIPNAKNDHSVSDSEMVAIPFKWEDVSGKARDSVPKKPNSRTSSTSTKPSSRASSISTKPNSRTSSTSTVSQKPNSRTSSTSTVSQSKANSRTHSTSNVSQKPANSRTSSTSTVPPKPNSRTSSSSTLPKKPNWNMSTSSTTSATPMQEVLKGSSTAAKKSLKSEFSFGGSHKFYGGVEKAFEKAECVREEAESAREPAESAKVSTVTISDIAAPPALKPLRTSTLAAAKATKEQEDVPKSPFSVPFKWEEEPGKAKFDLEDKAKPEEVSPALQLPPRLLSASVKRSQPTGTPTIRSPTSSTKASKTSTKQLQLGWASEPESTSSYMESVGKHHSRQGSGISSSKKFFDKDCFRRCRRLLVNLF